MDIYIYIYSTDLKPDCVIFSMQRKICIILEMTVPMDVNIKKWHSVKLENKSVYSKRLTRNGQYMYILLKSALEVSSTTELIYISYKWELIESPRPQRSAK